LFSFHSAARHAAAPPRKDFSMSWTIRELKTRGLAAFKANYWPCVAIALLAFFLANGGGCRYSRSIGGDGGSSSSTVIASEEAESLSSEASLESCVDSGSGDTAVSVSSSDSKWLGKDGKYRKEHPRRFALLVSVAVLVVFAVIAVAVAIRFLVFNPLLVGCRNFFLQNTACKADFNAVGAPFRSWKRVAKTMFLRDLFLFFWFLPAFAAWFVAAGVFLHTGFLSGEEPLPFGVFLAWVAAAALLFIPAIVKTYAYRLVPYLLADDPSLAGRAAVTRSRELMAGNKGKTFLLDLSFLGWHLLSLLTLGLLAVFRVLPWLYATDAELYRALAPRPLPPPLPPAADGR
jgi:uncharacterized membrane protein